jgi:hypothetical protein
MHVSVRVWHVSGLYSRRPCGVIFLKHRPERMAKPGLLSAPRQLPQKLATARRLGSRSGEPIARFRERRAFKLTQLAGNNPLYHLLMPSKHVRELSNPMTHAEKERSMASTLKRLIATGSNRQQLRKVLDLRVDPRTPRRFSKLLEELEKAETVRH